MKHAGAYLRQGSLVLYAVSKTTDGVLRGESPYVTLDASAPAEEKGAAVLDALSRSREGIPHPQQREGIEDDLLAAAGVKTWANFVKSTNGVSIDLEGEQISFIPLKNEGARGGFVEFEVSKIQLDSRSSARTVGAALDQAFAAAQ
jgi:hypothetical protein